MLITVICGLKLSTEQVRPSKQFTLALKPGEGKRYLALVPRREPLASQRLQRGAPLPVVLHGDSSTVRGAASQIQCVGSLGAEAAGLAGVEELGRADGVPVAGDSLAHLQHVQKFIASHKTAIHSLKHGLAAVASGNSIFLFADSL